MVLFRSLLVAKIHHSELHFEEGSHVGILDFLQNDLASFLRSSLQFSRQLSRVLNPHAVRASRHAAIGWRLRYFCLHTFHFILKDPTDEGICLNLLLICCPRSLASADRPCQHYCLRTSETDFYDSFSSPISRSLAAFLQRKQEKMILNFGLNWPNETKVTESLISNMLPAATKQNQTSRNLRIGKTSSSEFLMVKTSILFW